LPDPSDRPPPGAQVLVIRAAFVPDQEQPPPELSSDFRPLRVPVSLDPATGQIICDDSGTSFHRRIRAEWHPDENQETGGEFATGMKEEETPDEASANSDI